MGLDPLTLGGLPDDFIENEDGSVDIPDLEPVNESNADFYANLADSLPESILTTIGGDLVELIELDKKSRDKRDKQYEEGLRRTGLGDDAPGGAEFDGASKVVHPVLAEACVDFSSRAIKELFPASGPVKAWVNGETSPQKLERAERKVRFMNWQLTTQIEEYRGELEQLLTQLPMGGSQYQKFWYDERLGRARCEFVPIDEVFLPYAANNFYTASRVTHAQEITRVEFRRRVASGLYRDVFITDPGNAPEGSAASQANNKIEGREEDGYNEDGLRTIYEVYAYQELDDDEISLGEYAPYIITIDVDTEKVLSIYRNWAENDQKYQKLDWFVEWKFIPWRGAYAIGLPHLIGGLSAALTGALRALLDSAHINNAPTMLKLKAGRLVGQNTQVDVTQVCEIEGPAGIDDIRKLAMGMPFNPPSPVLSDLMDKLYGLAKSVVSTAEDQIGQVGDRTPVGTTMALIEQGSNTYSAIHARLHESQKRALAIVHRINSQYLDEENYIEELGEQIVTRDDFMSTLDVVPVSDPTIFSEAQRFAQSQSVMQMASADAANPNIRWNQVAVRRRILKQMRIDNIDELLPAPPEPVTADVLTENMAGIKGLPVKPDIKQDHFSHMRGHLAFLASPIQLYNPLIDPNAMMAMLKHVNEHLIMYQEVLLKNAIMVGSDAEIATIFDNVQQDLAQQLDPLLKQIGMLQQEVQKRMPPPPMPPEVQASLEIAKMETERKKQYDQATLQLKNQELSAKNSADVARHQMAIAEQQFKQRTAEMQQQFESYMANAKLSQEQQLASMAHHVEMLKNEQDNHQKQMTELLKNRDDNDTKMAIAQMQEQLSSMQATMKEAPSSKDAQPDLAPQLKQLQDALDSINKQQTNDALSSVMEGLKATIEQLNRPKMIIKDAQGKAIGIQPA